MPTAAVVSKAKISENFARATFLFTGVFTDTDESGVLKIDVSEDFSDENPLAAAQEIVIEAVRWWMNGSGTAKLIQTPTGGSPTDIVVMPAGNGELGRAGETALGAAGGDVTLTTTGLTSAGESYMIEVTVRKESGFSNVPVPVEAEILDDTVFVTGAVITAKVTFDRSVDIQATPQLELVIGENTRMMDCQGYGDDHTELLFTYTVVAADAAELTEVEFGDLSQAGGGNITGGSPWGQAILEGFDSDLDAVTVNAAAVVSTVALSGADSSPYATGEVIEITVTFDKEVTVTGVPQVLMTITSGDKNALYVGYGTTHKKLLFRYTVLAEDIAASSGFDITGDIDLNAGTIVNEDAPAVDAILTLAASNTAAVTIN